MATMYVTVAGAGAKSGANWANAFDLAAWENDATTAAAAGDIYYVEEGTYTLTGNWDAQAQDGTKQDPIVMIGVKSGTSAEPPTSSDWADGANRPLIAAAANTYRSGDYWIYRNFQHTTTHSFGVIVDGYCSIINCKSENSSNNDRPAFYLYQYANRVINCEAIASGTTKGAAIYSSSGTVGHIIGCYCHDSEHGIEFSNSAHYDMVLFCILDTCVNGILGATSNYKLIFNNTIYNCTNGILENVGGVWTVMNNIISDCTDGAKWTTEQLTNNFDFNNWYNNGTDVTNVTKGNDATAYEPKYTDAAAGDFSLGSTSSCIGAAFSIELGV